MEEIFRNQYDLTELCPPALLPFPLIETVDSLFGYYGHTFTSEGALRQKQEISSDRVQPDIRITSLGQQS